MLSFYPSSLAVLTEVGGEKSGDKRSDTNGNKCLGECPGHGPEQRYDKGGEYADDECDKTASECLGHDIRLRIHISLLYTKQPFSVGTSCCVGPAFMVPVPAPWPIL